jgi:hypothetical protein
MAERAKHDSAKDKRSFAKGDKEAPRKGKPKAAETAKTREAKASKGGRREREVTK